MSELTQVLESTTGLRKEFKNLENKIDTFNERFDNYHKATQWVVNLACSLIASATLITVVSSIFRRVC